tara:strand:+ start:425 stop:1387 length:963 start_codon:yes stop_codon:yes gene_type:complete
MKLVVITGCLGLIGNYVTRRCLERGWMVYGLDKMTYAANQWALEEFSKNKNFTFLRKDICKLKTLPDCDYVINIAAESHVGNSIVDSEDFLNTNILGVKNLLDVIRRKQNNVFKRPVFFHFSTDEVYGDILQGSHNEGDLLKPSNPYSASKAAADMLILAWARTYDLNYIILRPTNNYGIGQYPEKFIPLAIKMLQLGRKINLHNRGEPIRNWLHADDTAMAVIKIMESGIKNEIFNVSGNLEQKNYVTAKKILQSYFNLKDDEPFDYDKHFNLEHTRKGQDVRYALEDKKIKKLGWEAQRNFNEEISNLVFHYRKNFKW